MAFPLERLDDEPDPEAPEAPWVRRMQALDRREKAIGVLKVGVALAIGCVLGGGTRWLPLYAWLTQLGLLLAVVGVIAARAFSASRIAKRLVAESRPAVRFVERPAPAPAPSVPQTDPAA